MKVYTHSERPDTTIKLNNGKTRVFYSIVEDTEEHIYRDLETGIEITETVQVWYCRGVDLDVLDYETLVDLIIRDEYSPSQELSILRQKDTKPYEFVKYNNYAEYAKQIAREICDI